MGAAELNRRHHRKGIGMNRASRIKELEEIQAHLNTGAPLNDDPQVIARRLARVIELMLQDWKENPR